MPVFYSKFLNRIDFKYKSCRLITRSFWGDSNCGQPVNKLYLAFVKYIVAYAQLGDRWNCRRK